MKLFGLISAVVVALASAQENIECYVCDYSWVVAKVNGQEVTTPVRGSKACRDGTAENGDFGSPVKMPREFDALNGLRGRYKCSIVQAKGTETVYYDGGKYDVEFDVFDRKVLLVFNNSELFDHSGEIELTEDAYICGANRTECAQNLILKEEQAVKMAACPRCTASRSNGTWGLGDMTCMTGTVDGPTYPEVENGTCMFNPNPGISPTLSSHGTTARSSVYQQLGIAIDGSVEDAPGYEMSGLCVIWEEHYSLPDKKGVEQMYNLYRDCNSYDVAPFNFYSEMVMMSNNLTVCDEDKCNGPTTSGNSAGAMLQIWMFLTVIIFLN